MSELNLPEPIAAYFQADQHGGDAVARCFTKDAVVKDERQTHSGLAAIRAWKTAASAVSALFVHQRAFHGGAEGRAVHRHKQADGQLPGKPR